ncbi:hypothetical protein AYI69_g2769 [Smittium culicis]|uniref:Uncharacterized protein n=1 Tax=Smittium culicis TaxID=133412 RepID=A0A1R1YLL8_9FUNG|nr:hypothetical protein AYI69_g2769 [Smittium culicis]
MYSNTNPEEILTLLKSATNENDIMSYRSFNYNAHNRNLVVHNPFYKKCVRFRNKIGCSKKPNFLKSHIPLIDRESGTPPTEIIKNNFDYIKKQELSGMQEYSPSVGPETDLKFDAIEVVKVDAPEPDEQEIGQF